jgi:hypothetical protein
MRNVSLVGIVFWLVIFGISSFGIWSKIREEHERQLTIRAAIERGQPLDPALLEKIMGHKADKAPVPEQLLIGGLITLSAGVGLGVMGTFISQLAPPAFWPILGAGALVTCIGLGLVGAALLQKRLRKEARPQDPVV